MRRWLSLLWLFVAVGASAEELTVRKRTEKPSAVVKLYMDSLGSLVKYYDAHWMYRNSDTLTNPYYFPLFIRPTFYETPVVNAFEVKDTLAFLDRRDVARRAAINQALLTAYLTVPQTIQGTEQEFKETGGLREAPKMVASADVRLSEKIREPYIEPIVEPVSIVARRPNFWRFSGNYSLQFTQNYVSDNWYKGGESNQTALAQVNLRLNYDNKQKVVFENFLEMRLGFQTTPNDNVHSLRTNNDLLRLTNKIGLRSMIKNWYYTFQLQTWTQFLRGYDNNSDEPRSDFFSPMEMVISPGMEYKLNLKRFTLSANLAPFAYHYKYVDRLHLSTRYGLNEGKHSKGDLGSTTTITFKWDIITNVSWSGRIYYFSDYKKTVLEWENTLSFKINKYLNTKLFLFPRIDDGGKRGTHDNYLQFKEWSSIGLDMSF